jgi:hypothetical protein
MPSTFQDHLALDDDEQLTAGIPLLVDELAGVAVAQFAERGNPVDLVWVEALEKIGLLQGLHDLNGDHSPPRFRQRAEVIC